MAKQIWWEEICAQYAQIEADIIKLSETDSTDKRVISLQKQLKSIEKIYTIALEMRDAQDDLHILLSIQEEQNNSDIKQQILDKKRDIHNIENNYYKVMDDNNQPEYSEVILEIRPGTGGEEAALFARQLLDMYYRFATYMSWSCKIIDLNLTDIGGLDIGVLEIKGYDCMKLLGHESGAHRIQRIPKTESKGRIHTSIATIAVLAIESDDEDIDINHQYLRVDTFRAGGAGGQHVNKTDSAIRLTYNDPSYGIIIVSIQDEKSQHKNKAKALKILKAKLIKQKELESVNKMTEDRRSKVGSGTRAEKIRTYNVPQNRVTDARSKKSVYNLDADLLLSPRDLLEIINSIFKSKDDNISV